MNYLLLGEQTERLSFHLLTREYFDQWVSLFEGTESARFLGLNESLSPRELCEKWFEKVLNRYDKNLGGMNVLIDRNTGAFVGQSGLLIQDVDGTERLEVAYSILPKYWKMGYATEAARKCKEFAFENKFSTDLISIVHKDNIASERVARNNGMTIEQSVGDFMGMPVNIFSIKR